MEVTVTGGSNVTVSDDIFACHFNEGLVHEVVTSYMAHGRQGTKAQKTRSEVRGGGIKPWRQKGTGNARAGTIRSPIWRTGGVTFAAKPRSHAKKVNKKVYKRALAVIFSELLRQDRLIVVDELALSAPKTKELITILAKHKLERVLILLEGENKNVELAARNIPHVYVNDVAHLNLPNLLGCEKVLMTSAALKMVEEKIS